MVYICDMKLSVIILNYNVRYFLELCLISVQAALKNIESEIIVVDNNSPDDSCEMVKQRFPNVNLIENKENSGFPKGNNIGVAQAKGEFICILNPDTVVAEDTFEKILQFYQTQNNPGIIGVKLIDGTGNFLPESKRGIPTPFVAFTKITGMYKISNSFGKYYASHLGENESGKAEIFVGAFMFLKRDLYNIIGGFDERFFMYGEDVDFSYSVLKLGKSNYYFAGTSVIHYKGESTIKDQKYRKRFQDATNLFYEKHFERSAFFTFFMKTGNFIFSAFKKSQGKIQEKRIPDHYILLSESESQKQNLEKILKKNVHCTNIKSEKEVFSQTFSQSEKTELILDNNYLSFKKCISVLEKQKNKGFSFKILPKSSTFIIGSNSSNDRGEVIKIE